MSSSTLPTIPSLRRHQLLLEFASLKHAAPPGIYASVAPSDPTLWTSVLFVRSGPYASAILRFQIRFPPSYPDLPPLVTFSTDVFHPLIVPLTTYTFSTNASNEDPVSATDEERLPPGGFSLRHGFPRWFGREKRSAVSSVPSSRAVSVNGASAGAEATTESAIKQSDDSPAETDNGNAPSEQQPLENHTGPIKKSVPVSLLLDYIRSTFDNAEVLDSLPLEAAGNPSAWHAWKAHRKDATELSSFSLKRGSPQARLPGDWHWDGIWAKRVQDEIENSRSDATLFGNAARGATDDMIRFSRLNDAALASIKNTIVPRMEEAHE